VAFLSLVLVFAWTSLRVHDTFGGNWTGLFCTGTNFTVPDQLAGTTIRFNGDGYDG